MSKRYHPLLPMSHSRLNAASCQLRMWLERVKRVRINRPYEPFVYGTMIHSMLEHAITARLDQLTANPDLPHKTGYEKAIDYAFSKVADSHEFDPDETSALIETALWRLDPHLHEAVNAEAYGIEQHVLIDPNWEPTAKESGSIEWFQGKIDFFYVKDGVLHIFDYKTNRRTKSREEVFSDTQMRTYASLLGHSAFPGLPAKVHMYFILHDALVSSEYTVDLLAETRKTLDNKIIGLLQDWPKTDEEIPPATPSFNCSACPFAGTEYCPVTQHPIIQAANDGDYAYLTGQYEHHLGLAKLAERQIKEYVSEHGPVQSGNFRYNYTVTEEMDIDGETIVNVLLGARQSKLLGKVVSVNPKKLEKYLKFAPENVRHLVRGAVLNRRESHFKRTKTKRRKK